MSLLGDNENIKEIHVTENAVKVIYKKSVNGFDGQTIHSKNIISKFYNIFYNWYENKEIK